MPSRSLGSEIIVIIVIMYHDSGSAACRCRGEEVTELSGGAARTRPVEAKAMFDKASKAASEVSYETLGPNCRPWNKLKTD